MRPKIIAFDLDDVLCSRTQKSGGPEKYDTCFPIAEGVKLINECYDDGHTVIVYTARGMSVFKGDVAKVYSELYEKTRAQLDDWGIKYHQLVMGKLHYDVLIDDKALNSENTYTSDVYEFLKWWPA